MMPEAWIVLKDLILEKDAEGADRLLKQLPPGEIARAIARLPAKDQADLVSMLEPADAATLIEELPELQAAEILEDLPNKVAAEIVDEMPSDQQANVLGALHKEDASSILDEMDGKEARVARQLLSYEKDSVGSLMIKEYVTFDSKLSIDELLIHIRSNLDTYSGYSVLYAYVVDSSGFLQGVVRIRDLIFSRPEKTVGDLMIANPITILASSTLKEAENLLDAYPFLALPVVDEKHKIVGVLNRSAVQEALEENASNVFMKSSGILGGEELRSLPLIGRSKNRLSVLSVNILLNILAASIIAYFQDTLSAVIALAVFLPIISDLSGCSGNQAIAVSIRELSLGLTKPEDFKVVLINEIKMGLVNGLVLGFLLGSAAFIWKGNAALSLVVGLALAINTVVAVGLGGVIPLILRSRRLDPALVSAPILTTVTDMLGFLCVLGFATLVLKHLV